MSPRARHQQWMHQALAVAAEAAAQGEVPVGALVISPAGEVVAQAGNQRETLADPTAHAEVVALRAAAAALGSWRLHGCTLVVSLEPCTMCAGAVLLAQVQAVVFGAWDPKQGALGSLYDVVRDPRHNVAPQVYGGVLEAECGQVLREFFTPRR